MVRAVDGRVHADRRLKAKGGDDPDGGVRPFRSVKKWAAAAGSAR
jgi:hypothetical protein